MRKVIVTLGMGIAGLTACKTNIETAKSAAAEKAYTAKANKKYHKKNTEGAESGSEIDINTDLGFYRALLRDLDIRETPEKIKFLHAWKQHEDSTAQNNPFNATAHIPGTKDSNYNTGGVRNYPNRKTGLDATVAMLRSGHFKEILSFLKKDNVTANEITHAKALKNWGTGLEELVQSAYNRINFNTAAKLSYDVFKKAYTGYMNLKAAGKVHAKKDILTVVDFSQRSSEKRLWVIDLNNNKIVFNDLVAHGQGSGDAMATQFSNTNDSHQSSLGFYVTDDTYIGKHGRSLRMNGMDEGFNHSARTRAVVVHGAKYVNAARAASGSIGRSWGCPAVSDELAQPLINTIEGGTVLFVYAPQDDYLKHSTWLNKKLDEGKLAMHAPAQGSSVAYA